MMTPTMRHYVEGRLFEWTMSSGMVLLAVEIFLWPKTLEASSFYWLVLFLPGNFVGIFMLFIGVARIAALFANGRSMVHGPRVRAVGALAGAVMWAQMDLALAMPFISNERDIPSPGIPFWFMFTLAELYSAYRAAADVRDRSV
jgi:hypothetical protein